MFEILHDFTSSLPPLLRWLGVMLAAAVPFVESYFGSVIGVGVGINPFVAIPAAIVGNVTSMVAFVWSANKIRGTSNREREASPRRESVRRNFEKYGVPGVSLLGQTILPSQITSAALVSFGARPRLVVMWQIVSIVLWGTLFGVLASLGISLARVD